jgi:hypothetical protein
LRRLKESRPKLPRKEYIQLLVAKGFEKQHVEVVHDEIRNFIQEDDLSIYPDDDLHKIYRIEDFDDIALIDGICEKLNLRTPTQKDLEELNRNTIAFDANYILNLLKILTA